MADPDIRAILIVRPSALGDVCRTVPVLASLARAFPGAEIDWVVQDSYVPAIEAHPDLNRAIPFPRARFGRFWRSPSLAREGWRWFSDLRANRYQLVVDCQGLSRSGFITWCTGARRRVGERWAREFAWLGYNERYAPRPGVRHTVDRMLDLLAAAGIAPLCDLTLHVADAHRKSWERKQNSLGIDGPYAVLAPTARWRSKRWPVDRWRSLIAPLHERGFEHVIAIGAPDERDQVVGLLNHHAHESCVIDLIGETSLGETMAVIESAALVIANDSAPLHMAVGFDRPCIALFGPTDPALVGPYGRDDAVIRKITPAGARAMNYRDSALGDAAMRAITVKDVLSRLDAMFEPAALLASTTAELPGQGGAA